MTYLALQSHAMDLVAQLEAVGCGARPRYRRWTPQGHQAAAQTLRRCIAPRQMCMHLGALIGTGCHLQPVNLQGKRTRTPHWPPWEMIYPAPTTSASRRQHGQSTLYGILSMRTHVPLSRIMAFAVPAIAENISSSGLSSSALLVQPL